MMLLGAVRSSSDGAHVVLGWAALPVVSGWFSGAGVDPVLESGVSRMAAS